MAYVLIENGVVVRKQPNAEAGLVQAADWVVCGMLADGKGGYSNPPSPAPTVPESVESWQAKRALVAFGHYSLVEGAINVLGDDPESLSVKVDWASAKTFRRDWPALVALAAQLDLDSDDLDALFVHAATL